MVDIHVGLLPEAFFGAATAAAAAAVAVSWRCTKTS